VANFLRQNTSLDLGYYTGEKMATRFTRHKDKPPDIKHGIYKIPCDCGKVYVGETGRQWNKRINEHISDVNKNKLDTSALAFHMHQHPDHEIQFQSAEFIEKETRRFA